MKCPKCGATDDLAEMGVHDGKAIWRCQRCETAFSRSKLRARPVSPEIQANVEQILKAGGFEEYLAAVRQAAAQSFPDLPPDQALDNWHKLHGAWQPPSR